MSSLHCLSIDVEEYFHAEAFARSVPTSDWPRLEARAAQHVVHIADLLAAHDSRATFFVLGWFAERHRSLIADLHFAGHEIASHGYGHQHLARMTPDRLRDDLRRAAAVLGEITGQPPAGYRAPTFSLTRATHWALEILLEAEVQYDASIFPIRHDRYGIPDAPTTPFWLVAEDGRRLLEFPPLTRRVLGWRLPVGGGGYLRLLPSRVLHRCLAHAERSGLPTMTYLHPWELDPGQPQLPAGRLTTWRHRLNLHTTGEKLRRLLQAYRFERADRVLRAVRIGQQLPAYRLG